MNEKLRKLVAEIAMKTTVVNMRKGKGHPEHTIRIDRTTELGNPFIEGPDGNMVEVLQKYRKYILASPKLMAIIETLHGEILGCWCVDEPIDYVRPIEEMQCHGEIILGILQEMEQ